MAEITLDRIQKRFGDVVVVKELSLTIQDKEFFTFVGPSGCGKSTILGLIAGLEPLTAGTISFDGHPVNDVSPGDRDVAMVFQSYALYPHMNVYENMAFPLQVRKVPKERIDPAVSEVADILGLKQLLTRRPKELSGGQRQRVALGRALIRRPKAFLMDEPLSNLDARLRIEMRAELKRIQNEFQITTIYVTHDQEEALVLSDRVAVLYQGELQQCGPSLEVYEKPANRFIAEFIGSPPMNIFEGESLANLPAFQSVWNRMRPQDAILGIRPIDITVTARGVQQSLEAKALVLEPTGSDLWVTAVWKGVKVKGKAAPGESIQEESTAYFNLDRKKIHLFDKISGNRVSF
jgi:multiple sugar transport system ATP-binding protein